MDTASSNGPEVEPQPSTCPSLAFGVKVARNGRNVLEDAFAAQLDIACVTPVEQPAATPAPLRKLSSGGSEANPLSFFGVYDGHGGQEAAQHCASRLHENFLEELRSTDSISIDSTDSQDSCSSTQSPPDSYTSSSIATCLLSRVTATTACTSSSSSSCLGPPGTQRINSSSTVTSSGVSTSDRLHLRWRHAAAERQEAAVREALRRAYIRTDMELQGTEVGEVVGSTAVTAVVSNTQVYIAHCGDSRAVLCRKGRAIALTADHKPDRKDEADRVAASGGKVLYKGGSHRVMGLLAMSRAIGDHFLRPYVIPEPEVMCFTRTAEDELLLLASDGLWDVFNSQEAVALALRSNARALSRGASKSAACRVSASVLTTAAIERGSRDNITVLVVDLQQPDVPPSRSAILATQCSEDSAASGSSRLHKRAWGSSSASPGGLGSEDEGLTGSPPSSSTFNSSSAHRSLGPCLSAPVHRRAHSTVTTEGPAAWMACSSSSSNGREDPAAAGAATSLRAIGGEVFKSRTQSFSSYELGRVHPPLPEAASLSSSPSQQQQAALAAQRPHLRWRQWHLSAPTQPSSWSVTTSTPAVKQQSNRQAW